MPLHIRPIVPRARQIRAPSGRPPWQGLVRSVRPKNRVGSSTRIGERTLVHRVKPNLSGRMATAVERVGPIGATSACTGAT